MTSSRILMKAVTSSTLGSTRDLCSSIALLEYRDQPPWLFATLCGSRGGDSLRPTHSLKARGEWWSRIVVSYSASRRKRSGWD